MYDIEDLNGIQKTAVLDTEGAVLVTAGAGSGKTRLLTHRIAHLIKDLGVLPYNVLAITFTNKAANEMRERLERMLGNADGIWIFTFHAACVRMLRHFGNKIGIASNFTIYGEAETKSVVKRICKENEYNEDMVKRIISAISAAKNKGILPEDYAAVYKFSNDSEEIAKAYSQYCTALGNNNALDYDDLLLYALYMLKTDAEAREYYQNKFRYIHIDEFQDTNAVQYDIAVILAGKHGNIFAVGDEDQCIYSWRGASIENIFKFQRDFGCKLYKLEQNYRSTSNILEVANKIIKGNVNRLDKRLWTESGAGEKVNCFAAETEGFEADYVIRTLYELVYDGEYNYSDCAILFRLNALTRAFEERCMQYGIPHKVFGGFKFYDRKEVKDVLAYVRLSVNTRDDEALYRIINFPRRGIGETSVEKIRQYCRVTGKSAFEVITSPNELPVASSLKQKLKDFGDTLIDLCGAAQGDISSYFKHLLYTVLDVDRLFSDDDDDGARLENIGELVNSVRDFRKNNPSADLSDYLQSVSLYSDTDDMNGDNAVTLATVHSAKGLEFPVVFVVGLEDGIFPSLRVNENNSEHMEEERRLMYVAVTRAKRRLYLTYAKARFLYGDTKYSLPSRFLSECGLVQRKSDMADVFTSSPSHKYRGCGDRSGGYASNATEIRSSYAEQKFDGAYKSDFGKRAAPQGQQQHSHSDKCAFTVGATVVHKRLGSGKIIGVENMGNGLYVKIDFERGGVMLLAADFAPLTVVKE